MNGKLSMVIGSSSMPQRLGLGQPGGLRAGTSQLDQASTAQPHLSQFGIPCCCCSWEDGEEVSKALTAPDRWAVHQAEEVEVTLGTLGIRVIQKVGRGGNPSLGARLR